MTDRRMGWADHLSELRRRFLITLAVFIVLLVVCLSLVSRIYNYLVQPLTRTGYHLVVVSPGEVVTVYLSMAGLVAAGLTLPVALHQLWLFVRPGLTPSERRFAVRLLPLLVVMFLAGVAFAWFVVFPMVLKVLVTLASQQFTVMIRADAYFSFLTGLCLPFGFVFELPIVVVFLTRIGLVTPAWLRRMRRWAYLIIVVAGVMISPPELVAHLSVVVPMILLYECSILLSAVAYRKREALRAAHADGTV
ncbi:MAG: twin-arginine translocase subunit TatC [Thermoflavifilum sp.]|nr:twin-arginine translocase subunit TatC [Thermoflavifilum sp.]MCL6513668.1 twin-arginine translocase subunit TatC [Alicyclobacillus sp.]